MVCESRDNSVLFLLTSQVSRVPGYQDRLKATLFKANFAEKVEEVGQVNGLEQRFVTLALA